MKNCLILDNTSQLKSQLSSYLSTKDFSVSLAQNYHSGLEYCKDHMPDVIFLDANTPRRAMQSFLQKLEKQHTGIAPVVIYCAQDHAQQDVDRAIIDGATDYLIMPMNKDIFTFKLRQSGLIF